MYIMFKKLFNKNSTKMLGLIAFIATGGGLIGSTAIHEESFYKTEILIILGCFFIVSLADHYRMIKESGGNALNIKRSLYIFACSFVGVTVTWFINHKMGYGAVIANGLVGVMAATFLPNDLAGITYTSFFIGMSSLSVIPSLSAAVLGSLIVSVVFLTTAEIYAGIGGKGGTTAALSTIITKTIFRFLG